MGEIEGTAMCSQRNFTPARCADRLAIISLSPWERAGVRGIGRGTTLGLIQAHSAEVPQ